MSQLPLRPIEFRGHTLQTFAAGDPAADTDDLPPIIFLHGFFVSLRFVPHAVPLAVRDSRRWHAVSLPCHPPAAAPLRFAKGDISPDWLADMVAHVAETLSPSRPPVLVGHSAGGFAVLNAAARDPARYAAVAAVNGFINGGLTLMERALQLLARAGPAGRLGFALSLKAGVINADLHERMSAGLAGDGESLRDNARLRRAIDAYLPDLQDLTPRQTAILLIVYLEPPPHTVRGLAQRLGVTKPVITRALTTLGGAGLLKRRRDETDKRNVLVARTVEGSLYLERLSDMIVQEAESLPRDVPR